jgi:4,5-dihydroxyphthalate decarboxylase
MAHDDDKLDPPTRNGRLVLSLAISDYDHVRALTSGDIRPEGIELVPQIFGVEEIFYRTARFREWDVSEMSFAKYVALRSQGDTSLVGIPVFPSRVFRHSAIYVRSDGTVRQPQDLMGRRIGVPEWAQTAGIYVRGMLTHDHGIDLARVEWLQAGVSQPGRIEKVSLNLPAGVSVTAMPARTLDDMLLTGDVDAIITAHPPDSAERGDPRVRRLFEDFQPVEEDYFRRTGVFPIMHVIAVRGAVLERAPWVAMNLLTAFETAKQQSIARAADLTASRFPVPWGTVAMSRARALFGANHWPYGVAANHRTLDAFLGFAFEQGVCRRRLAPEELFPASVQAAFAV